MFIKREVPAYLSTTDILRDLRSNDATVRAGASGAFYHMQPPYDSALTQPLIAALQDPSPEVRTNAIYSLGKLGGSEAVSAIIVSLQDSEKSVRMNAIETLGDIGDVSAVQPLLEAMQALNTLANGVKAKIGRISDYHHERVGFIEAFGKLADARAVDTLISMLSIPLEEDFHIRPHVINALGKIGDPRAIDSLRAVAGLTNTSITATLEAHLLIPGAHVPVLAKMGAKLHEPARTTAIKVLQEFFGMVMSSTDIASGVPKSTTGIA